MKQKTSGTQFYTYLAGAPTGLEGTLGVTIKKESDLSVVAAREVDDVVEIFPGNYRLLITAPLTVGKFIADWDGGGIDAQEVFEVVFVNPEPDEESVAPGETFYDYLQGAPTGMVGTLAARMLNESSLAVLMARTTSGIAEHLPGNYRKQFTAPTGVDGLLIVWDNGTTFEVSQFDVLPQPVGSISPIVLYFIPPDISDLVKLHVYEAPTPDGPWVEIETSTEIGTYPEYINQYIVTMAQSLDYYYAISWEDENGLQTELSSPVLGRTASLVYQIAGRVTLRDSSVDQTVALQEAESVLEMLYGTSLPVTLTALQFSGITSLVLARVITQRIAQVAESSQYVAGLISQKSDVKEMQNAINLLLEEAARDLRIRTNVIAQMCDIPIAGGQSVISTDITRLLVEVE